MIIKTQFYPIKLSSKELSEEEVNELGRLLNKVWQLYNDNKVDVVIVHKGTVEFNKNKIIFERLG